MTGSARTLESILPAAPIVEDAAGNAGLAIAGGSIPAFAVALDGAPPGGVVTYGTDGIIERKDWFLIAGTSHLQPGKAYYLSGVGRLSLEGEQQIGVARSATVLRIQILQPVPKVSQIWPVTSEPTVSLGKVGDIAYDSVKKRIFGPKSVYGWGQPSHLVDKVFNRESPIQLVYRRNTGVWAAYAS